MKVGDVLEIGGAVALTVAAYWWLGIPGGLLVGGSSLVYLGNCWADFEFPRSEAKRKLVEARAQLELGLSTPGFFPDDVERLRQQVRWWESQATSLPERLQVSALARWRQRK